MSPAINPRGTRIREYVQRFAPSRYAQIQDPETFFPELMSEYVQKIDEIHETLAGQPRPPSPEELQDPLGMLGRHRALLSQAREMAWQDVVLDRFPPEVDETGTPLETTGQE